MAGDDGLSYEPGWRIADRIARKDISPVEVARHFLDRIARLDPQINAFITLAGDQYLAQAAEAERAVMRDDRLGPLHGLPVSVKDQISTRGIRTTGGSLLLRDNVPAEDAACVERVKAAGGAVIGKTNLPEFAMSAHTTNRLAGPTRNPWAPGRSPGGSSGGAAAALAAGMGPLAIGSDGGGSLRIPAALCGVFTLLPGTGRVPRHGSFGETLFATGLGPMTRDVRDAAALLQVIAGADPRDGASSATPPGDYLAGLDAGVKGLRLAWCPDLCREEGDRPDPAVIAAVAARARALAQEGAVVEELGDRLDDISDAFWVITNGDRASSVGQDYYLDPARRALLTPTVRERLKHAMTITAGEYTHALRMRYRFIAAFRQYFERYDAILTPTAAMVAPPVGDVPSAAPSHPGLTAFTKVVNFVGCPAASVPCGLVDGLPVGLQIIGARDHEALVLRIARTLEGIAPWADSYRAIPLA
ncbi:amidase [Ruixingdingia sedimenti]|uniref:Amidase n=1 Tax=Ruixingdingia sedimenti TaxID=3073604 RepID=A0ABU1F8S7_9RHOB|nr:amidase [Xinfangfangia sp. LG-4]MDR5653234.1 amidase [Xinfangfangia sp. LG-4]